MIETMIVIILSPIALTAAAFTVAIGVGLVRAVFKK